MNPGISFIIPVHEETIYLDSCIQSILQQEDVPPVQIIIVLNNYHADLSHYHKLHHDLLIAKEPKQGPSYARNLGITLAKYNYVAFLDCDVSLRSNWAKTNLELLEQYPQMACVQAKIKPRFRNKAFLEMYRATTVRMITKGTFNYLNNPSVMPSLNTAALLCRKEHVVKVGLFSIDFKKLEDTDFTYKLLRHGYAIGVNLRSSASVFNNHRSFLKYLKRSLWLGRYGHKLQSKWELPSNKLVSLDLSGKSWKLRIISKLNFFVHSFGLKWEKFLDRNQKMSPQKIVNIHQAPEDPFKISIRGENYVLKPSVRVLIFTHKIHFINFQNNTVVLFKKSDMRDLPPEIIRFAFQRAA